MRPPEILVVVADSAEAAEVGEPLARAGFRAELVRAVDLEARPRRERVDLVVFGPGLSGAGALRALDAVVPAEAQRPPAVLRVLPPSAAWSPVVPTARERWLRGPLGEPALAGAVAELLAADRPARPPGRARWLGLPLLVAAAALLLAGLADRARPAAPVADAEPTAAAGAALAESPAAGPWPAAPTTAGETSVAQVAPPAPAVAATPPRPAPELAPPTPAAPAADVAAAARLTAPDPAVIDAGPRSALLGEDAVPAAPAAKAAEPAPRPSTHTVVWGDTLWDLAQRHGTTVSELAALNGISNPDLILVGQLLVLPVGS